MNRGFFFLLMVNRKYKCSFPQMTQIEYPQISWINTKLMQILVILNNLICENLRAF